MRPKVVVITGPTATGKTRLGAALARQIGGEVVGADSMQIYKGMDIGTAKPTPEETLGVPHHMIGIVSPLESYSVARYVEDGRACVQDILARQRIPVIVGGTGLYIASLLADRTFAEEGVQSGLRAELSARYDAIGGEAMLAELEDFDPVSAQKLHPHDKKRIVRAFEVYRATGSPISAFDQASREREPRYDACKIALTFAHRTELYRRINQRVDRMMEQGLLQEVRTLLESGLTQEHTAMQAIGYKELAQALESGAPIEEAVETIKTGSRHYAKRQLSWLRRDPDIHWILWEDQPNFAAALRDSTKFLEKYGIL